MSANDQGRNERAGEHNPADDQPSRTSDEKRAADSTVPATDPVSHFPRIDGYRICSLIGAGGMGTVYEAEQLKPRRPVALKVLKPEHCTPSALRRFEGEVEVLARLNHPHIARIYEACSHHEGSSVQPYYAMELISDARNLTQYAEENDLSIGERLELFIKVCDAIHAGHCRGVVHRDLKPENILVDETGEPKVIDFGVSRILSRDFQLHSGETLHGQIIGTLPYMSPEQATGNQDAIDQRSDVYALGVILFELLTGELPYSVSGLDVIRAVQVIQETPPKRPSTIRRALKGDLDTIILKALEKSRARRFQSVHELSENLQRFLRDEPLLIRPLTVMEILGQRARSIARRQPGPILLCLAALAALVTEFVGVPALYHWTGLSQQYRTALVGMFPQSTLHLSGLEHVRLININRDLMERLPEVAKRHGVDGVTVLFDEDPVSGAIQIDNLETARRLHGHLMERLAKTNVRAVVWDLAFPAESDSDEAFRRGVMTLREKAVPTAVVTTMWGERNVSPVFERYVRLGAATAAQWVEGDPRVFFVDLAIDRGRQETLRSIAMQGVAAYLHPHLIWSAELDKQRGNLSMHFYGLDREHPEARREWKDKLTLPLTFVETAPEDAPMLGIREGDVTVGVSVRVPSRDALRAATRSYEWVLDAPQSDLKRFVDGKMAVIGISYADRFAADEDSIAGYEVQAAAIDAVLQQQIVRLERRTLSMFVLSGAALVGVFIGVLLWKTLYVGIVLAVIVIAGLVAASLYVYAAHAYMFNPLTPTLALLIAAFLAVYLKRFSQSVLFD